jgi:2-polyprenyl-3-methyl-5-hydroxy-6-metoxy-1,4-benzoquinol methylase
VSSASRLTDSPRVCPVCQSENFKRLRNCKDKANPLWRKCSKCKTVYARTVPSSEELADLYLDYYNSESPEVPAFVAGRLRNVFTKLNYYRSDFNRILDIGFGAGTFLDVASQEGWQCHGSEFSPDSVKEALDKGWSAHLGELTDSVFAGPYDLVSAIEVLEHVSSPGVIVKQASVRLRKGGAFYGTTPNGESLNLRILGESWSVLSYPEHQVLLNTKSLKILFGKSDLKSKFVKTKGINPADAINFYKIKKRQRTDSFEQMSNRVDLGYSINSVFERNFALRIIKRTINSVLNLFKIGDSIEFLANR